MSVTIFRNLFFTTNIFLIRCQWYKNMLHLKKFNVGCLQIWKQTRNELNILYQNFLKIVEYAFFRKIY